MMEAAELGMVQFEEEDKVLLQQQLVVEVGKGLIVVVAAQVEVVVTPEGLA